MGQRANSGRNASLDEKKERAAGRDQNSPSQEAITDRQAVPPVAGAFGREGQANRPDAGEAGTMVTGETSGGTGGPEGDDVKRRSETP